MEDELLDVTKKSGVVFSGKIIGMFFGLLFSLLVARYLGAETYGTFMYVYSFLGFFPIIVILGLDQGLVFFIPQLTDKGKTKERNSLITFSITVIAVLSLIIIFVVILKNRYIADKILNNGELGNLLRISAPMIMPLAVIQLARGIFRGTKKIHSYVISENIIIPVVKIFSLFIVLLLGYRLYGLVTVYYFGLSCGCIYLLFSVVSEKLFHTISLKYRHIYRGGFIFSFPLLLTGFLSLFVKKFNLFMTGFYLSDSHVGIYNIALQVGTMSSVILYAFNTMFAPVISSLYHKGQMKKLTEIYKAITRWIAGINLLAFSLILLFSREIMTVFGTEFVIGSKALIIIAAGEIVNAGVGSAGIINIMTGYPQYELLVSLISVIVYIILNILLIPARGIEGAAIAFFAYVGIGNLLRLLFIYINHRIHPYDKSYFKLIFPISCAFLITYVLNRGIELHYVGRLVIFPVLFAGIAFFTYYLTGLSATDKIILRVVRNRLKK
jgi:O-antigen/teichoic acid export membrane protein